MKNTSRKSSVIRNVLAASILFSSAASAQTIISVNFDDGGGDAANAYTTGAVSAGNWNNVNFGAAGSPTIDSALTFDDGTSSSFSISLENRTAGSSGGFDAPLSGATDDDAILYSMRNRNGGAIASLSGISFSQYDVYVYYGLVDISLKLDSASTPDPTDLDYNLLANSDGSSFVQGSESTAGNYFVFEGLSDSAFTLTSGHDGDNGFIYGMQIVDTSVVPEPSSFAFIAGVIGLTSSMLRRRRR